MLEKKESGLQKVDKVSAFTKITLLVFSFFFFVFLTGGFLGVNLYLITAISLVMIFLFFAKRNQIKVEWPSFIQFLFLYFLLYALVSISWSRAPSYGLYKIYIIISIFIVFSLYKRLIVRHHYIFIKYFTIIFIASEVLYLINNGFSAFNISSEYYRFDMGDTQNPIVVAFYFGFGFITLLYYALVKKRPLIITIIVLAGAALAFALCFLTGSKGPLLALILSSVVYFFLAQGIKIKNLFKWVLVLLILSTGLYLIRDKIEETSILYEFAERRFLGGEGKNSSLSSRFMLFNEAKEGILDDSLLLFLFGHGSGDFGYQSTKGDNMMYPHNIFLEIFYEYGLFSFLIFLFLVLRTIHLNLKWKYDQRECYYFFIFYYILFISLVSRDIAGNCLVFIMIIYIDELNRYKVMEKRNNKVINIPNKYT